MKQFLHILHRVLLQWIIISFPISGIAQTKVSDGSVQGRWTKNNSPYYITGDVIVQHGRQLELEAGVQVLGYPGTSLTVKGIIEAIGTEAEKILFTASDTAKGWHGIHFINAENGSRLLYCSLMYGQAIGVMTNELAPIPQGSTQSFTTMGGGIFCFNSSPSIEHCVIVKNISLGNGGGIYCAFGKGPHIWKSLVAFNKSIHWGGGGISSHEISATIADCLIEENISVKWTGGGIYSITSRLLMQNNTIRNNSSYGGGGVFLQADSSSVSGCTIVGNNAKYGGGIECNENCITKLIGNTITNNTADYGGGMALVEQSFVSVEDCRITGNQARKTGGGIFIAEVGKPRIVNSHVSDNVSDGDGGGITCLDVDPIFENVLLAGNRAANNGGGLYVEYTNLTLSKVNIFGNVARRGGGIYIKNCPSIEFSQENLCNIHQNLGNEFGSDVFAFSGPVIHVDLDTFTVDLIKDIHAYPLEKLKINHKHEALSQEKVDLYVNPDGDDNSKGTSPSSALRTINMALMKILADSLNPRIIHLADGEYDGTILSSPFAASYLKYASVSGGWFADIQVSVNKITVHTPWWKSTWAFILYLSIIGIVIYTGYQSRIKNLRLKQQVEMKNFQTERLAEVDKLKSRFFSNISHEFRTPLTLILGPADQALEANDMKSVRQKLSLIKDNAKKLFGLVNQLLDFSRLESGVMKLQVSSGDVVCFLRRVVMSFESWAERKKITLTFSSDVESAEGFFDADKLEKIMNNLISNALKFTPEGGSVNVNVRFTNIKNTVIPTRSLSESILGRPDSDADQKHVSMTPVFLNNGGAKVVISVADTGPGIPAEHLPNIFNRFYRADNSHNVEGTGIGLALVWELTQLHHGTVTVESSVGKGTTFTVTIPIDKSAYLPEEIGETPPEMERTVFIEPPTVHISSSTDITTDGKPIVLVVEDNTDLRAYIREFLDTDYAVYEAGDGKAGLERATEIIPDIVISDVMMPEMDGIELCKALKQDLRTSHIPVILLTARAGTDSKIEGLEIGADDYVTKPFDSKELLARVKNLIEQRKQLRKKFSAGVVLKPGEVAVTSLDDALLKNIMSAVEKNIGDENFSVDDLAKEACLSRAQLNRKLHALTNLSPAEFIRYVRLQRAYELLEKNTGTVADVAYQVGFGSPAHFSKCFHDRFGYPPSEVHARKRKM